MKYTLVAGLYQSLHFDHHNIYIYKIMTIKFTKLT